MKVLVDFQCSDCGEVVERYIDSTTMKVECKCGGIAEKLTSAPTVRLEGISGDFPGAHARWAKIREDNYRNKQRKER